MRNIDTKELLLIDKLLGVDFKGRDILKEQISKAKALIDENYTYISIKFSLEDVSKKFPYNIRVPIEMRVFRESLEPILILLHVVNGFVKELEILTADFSEIDINSINLDKVEYEVNKELIIIQK